jgi:hypothetical protein
MEIAVSVFALLIAAACVIAIFIASRRDQKQDQGD